jgi:hypothetical protein
LSRNVSSITGALAATKDIVCTQEFDGFANAKGAKQYVITLSQENQTARLTRTGGDWGTPEDFGNSSVTITPDNRGTFPALIVHSRDASGNNTDELDLTITGSMATATIRFDSVDPSTGVKITQFKTIKFKCDN